MSVTGEVAPHDASIISIDQSYSRRVEIHSVPAAYSASPFVTVPRSAECQSNMRARDGACATQEGRKDMRHAKFGLILVGVLAATLALAGCGASSATSPTTGNTSNTGSNTSTTPQVMCSTAGDAICTKSISVGGSTKTVLATNTGKTLYYFTADTTSAIACSASCASVWPPLMAPSASVSGNFGLSGTVSVDNGANGAQLAYNGHPLYTYSKDQSITDATGDGFNNKWFAATTDVQPLSSGGSNGGYGGYGNLSLRSQTVASRLLLRRIGDEGANHFSLPYAWYTLAAELIASCTD